MLDWEEFSRENLVHHLLTIITIPVILLIMEKKSRIGGPYVGENLYPARGTYCPYGLFQVVACGCVHVFGRSRIRPQSKFFQPSQHVVYYGKKYCIFMVENPVVRLSNMDILSEFLNIFQEISCARTISFMVISRSVIDLEYIYISTRTWSTKRVNVFRRQRCVASSRHRRRSPRRP